MEIKEGYVCGKAFEFVGGGEITGGDGLKSWKKCDRVSQLIGKRSQQWKLITKLNLV